ncbi:hypothetical protein DTO166G4_4346 [Paecilomyces variotii]|nr:hypothetical protein DTO166G4_4346 [Paecilomyces variotii]
MSGSLGEKMLYTSGGRGSMRYFFLHGNHGAPSLPETLIVEASVVVFDPHGNVLYGKESVDSPKKYHFENGKITHVEGEESASIPVRQLTETLLKNVSVPTLIVVELTSAQNEKYCPDAYQILALSVLERSDRHSSLDDRNYIMTMMPVFVPCFVRAISLISAGYLPGNVRDLAREVAAYMESIDSAHEFNKFLELYRQRYIRKPVEYNSQVLETCLLYMLKMPFDLASSIDYSFGRWLVYDGIYDMHSAWLNFGALSSWEMILYKILVYLSNILALFLIRQNWTENTVRVD